MSWQMILFVFPVFIYNNNNNDDDYDEEDDDDHHHQWSSMVQRMNKWAKDTQF